MIRGASFIVACSLWACAHQRLPTSYPGTPVIVFEEPTYDGREIRGRVRIEANDGPVVFDGRLIENVTLYLRDVRACDTGEGIRGYLIVDYFPEPPVFDDLVTVKPAYFYGTSVRYPVFKEPGPDCIDVAFTFHSGVKPMTAEGEAAVKVRFQKTKPPQ